MRGRPRYVCLDKFCFVFTFAKHDCVAAQPLAIWMAAEILGDRRKGPRQVKIIAVEISDNVAGHTRQPFVNRIHLPAIFFADPKRQSILVTPNYLNAVVRAATIDDDVLEVLIILIEY